MRYDPHTYWSQRSYPTRETGVLPAEREFFEPHLQGVQQIVDYGVGIGRFFPLYADCDVVYGVDIVNTYKKRVLKAAERYPFTFHHHVCDIREWPYSHVDVAVASKVLLHVQPAFIVAVMRALGHLASQVLVSDIHTAHVLAAHNVSHDFRAILEQETFDLKYWNVQNNQCYFIYNVR